MLGEGALQKWLLPRGLQPQGAPGAWVVASEASLGVPDSPSPLISRRVLAHAPPLSTAVDSVTQE